MKQTHLQKIDNYPGKLTIIYSDFKHEPKISPSTQKQDVKGNWKMPPACEKFLKPKKNDPL